MTRVQHGLFHLKPKLYWLVSINANTNDNLPKRKDPRASMGSKASIKLLPL